MVPRNHGNGDFVPGCIVFDTPRAFCLSGAYHKTRKERLIVMKFVIGSPEQQISAQMVTSGELDGQQVTVHGAVHALRRLGGIAFLTLRMGGRTFAVCVSAGD